MANHFVDNVIPDHHHIICRSVMPSDLSSSQLQRDVASRAFSAARRQRAQCTGSCRGRLCACRIARERYGFVSPSLSDSSRAYSRPAESTRTRYSEPSERAESRRRPLASTRLRARARARTPNPFSPGASLRSLSPFPVPLPTLTRLSLPSWLRRTVTHASLLLPIDATAVA